MSIATIRQFKKALREADGIMAHAAVALGMTRQAVFDRVQKSPELKRLLVTLEEELLDTGEGHITKGVKSGDKEYVRYYMERKGRRRGYGNKVETSFDETQIQAIVAALGGNPDLIRDALIRLGAPPAEST